MNKSTTFTVSVTETSAKKNNISLSASAPTGVQVTVRPSIILPGTPATVTVLVTAAATAGAQPITFTGSDASGSSTINYTLTAVPLPTMSITPAATAISLVQGTSGTISFNVATGGSFSGNVNLAIADLPTGVSATWATSPVSPASSISSTNDVLTLTATTTAKVATGTVVVTATGDEQYDG